MSAATDLLLLERRNLLTRLRSTLSGLAANRTLVLGVASAGLVITFGAMVATGGPGRIGAIWFVPWVVLLASQLGPAGGAIAGAAATAVYFIGAEVIMDTDDPLAL